MTSMIRRSYPMLASNLLLTNAESHKRKSSGYTTLSDSGAANVSLATGLTVPTMGSIQIRIKDAGRLIIFSPYSSERAAGSRRWPVVPGISKNNTER